MKLNSRVAQAFALSVALFSASALAQDAGAAAPAAPATDAAAAPAAHHAKHMKKAKGAVHGAAYDSCVKQKLAVSEYFCSIHPDACQAEKDGAATQCRSEARGERQKG